MVLDISCRNAPNNELQNAQTLLPANIQTFCSYRTVIYYDIFGLVCLDLLQMKKKTKLLNYEYLLNSFSPLFTNNDLYNELVSVVTHLYTSTRIQSLFMCYIPYSSFSAYTTTWLSIFLRLTTTDACSVAHKLHLYRNQLT